MNHDKKREKWLTLCKNLAGGECRYHLRIPLRKKMKYGESEIESSYGTYSELRIDYDSGEITLEHDGHDLKIPHDLIISLAKYLED